MRNDEVLGFIRHFHGSEKVFTEGCCYWFAYILSGRFSGAEAIYLQVPGHFVTRIGGRLYDVTGDVTDRYAAEPQISWSDVGRTDASLERIVTRDVIMKTTWACRPKEDGVRADAGAPGRDGPEIFRP